MRRVVNLSWVVAVSVLLIWLYPFLKVSRSRVEEGVRKAQTRSLSARMVGWLINQAVSLFTWYGKWRRERLYRKIDRFLERHCNQVWGRRPKMGFLRLGSKKAQTVLEHRLAVEERFDLEADREGLSGEERMEGRYRIRVHELDEVTSPDHERLKLPRRIAERGAFVEREWWPDEDWIPSRPGDVSLRWRRDYEEGRKVAHKFLCDKGGRRFASKVIGYYDAFHVGMDRVSILCRDNHYAETVEEGIREKVPVRHFALEAMFAIANPRIRADVTKTYMEGVAIEEQEPIET